MKIKEVSYHKEYKLGLPNYSNITVGFGVVVELAEGETANHNEVWDEINHEIFRQADLDPSWFKKEDLKESTKYILKIPKDYEKKG